jgi:hypothetical protein
VSTDGVLPPPFPHLLGSLWFALQLDLLQQPEAKTPDYADQVADLLALLGGTYCSAAGAEAHVVPGEGATWARDVQVAA